MANHIGIYFFSKRIELEKAPNNDIAEINFFNEINNFKDDIINKLYL